SERFGAAAVLDRFAIGDDPAEQGPFLERPDLEGLWLQVDDVVERVGSGFQLAVRDPPGDAVGGGHHRDESQPLNGGHVAEGVLGPHHTDEVGGAGGEAGDEGFSYRSETL